MQVSPDFDSFNYVVISPVQSFIYQESYRSIIPLNLQVMNLVHLNEQALL